MIEIIPNFHPALVHFSIAFATAAVFFTTLGKVFNGWPYAAQRLFTLRDVYGG